MWSASVPGHSRQPSHFSPVLCLCSDSPAPCLCPRLWARKQNLHFTIWSTELREPLFMKIHIRGAHDELTPCKMMMVYLSKSRPAVTSPGQLVWAGICELAPSAEREVTPASGPVKTAVECWEHTSEIVTGPSSFPPGASLPNGQSKQKKIQCQAFCPEPPACQCLASGSRHCPSHVGPSDCFQALSFTGIT